MKQPNFLIIGAPKAGTTSLYQYLSKHPEIYMCPTKEPGFFLWSSIDLEQLDEPLQRRFQRWKKQQGVESASFENYLKLYQGMKSEKAAGEATPSYLYSRQAAEQIKFHLPQAKLIAILRNPVDRILSQYSRKALEGKKAKPLMEAIAEDNCGSIDYHDLGYSLTAQDISRGFYAAHLRKYFEIFPNEQMKIVLFDDLCDNPQDLLKEIFTFLKVDAHFLPDTSIRYNETAKPSNPLLKAFLERFPKKTRSRIKILVPDAWRRMYYEKIRSRHQVSQRLSLSQEERQKILLAYRDDILQLQDLIHRDLSAWL